MRLSPRDPWLACGQLFPATTTIFFPSSLNIPVALLRLFYRRQSFCLATVMNYKTKRTETERFHGPREIESFALEYQRVICFLFSIDPPRISNWLLPSTDRSRKTWKFSSVSPKLPYSRRFRLFTVRGVPSCTIMSFRAIGASPPQRQYIANHAD